MAKMTMVFGGLLVAMGVVGYVLVGSAHSAGLGVLLLICGLVANTENVKRRMIAMHIAVVFGLFGVLMPGIGGILALIHAHTAGVPLVQPTIVHLRLIVAAICLVYVVLCVRSFISARKARIAS